LTLPEESSAQPSREMVELVKRASGPHLEFAVIPESVDQLAISGPDERGTRQEGAWQRRPTRNV
jgi:hypothetical protein